MPELFGKRRCDDLNFQKLKKTEQSNFCSIPNLFQKTKAQATYVGLRGVVTEAQALEGTVLRCTGGAECTAVQGRRLGETVGH